MEIVLIKQDLFSTLLDFRHKIHSKWLDITQTYECSKISEINICNCLINFWYWTGYFPKKILKNRSLWRIMCLAHSYLNKNNDAICNRKVSCCAITTISIIQTLSQVINNSSQNYWTILTDLSQKQGVGGYEKIREIVSRFILKYWKYRKKVSHFESAKT